MVVEAQSLGVGAEEGVPFQAEGVVEEGPYPAVEVGVEVRNQAGEEVVVVRNLVVEEGEGEGVVDKVQARVREGGAVVEEEEGHRLVNMAVVEVGVEELDGRRSVASAGRCRRSSL